MPPSGLTQETRPYGLFLYQKEEPSKPARLARSAKERTGFEGLPNAFARIGFFNPCRNAHGLLHSFIVFRRKQMKRKFAMNMIGVTLAFGLILAGCGDNGSAGSAALSAPSGVSAVASSSSMSIRVTWDSVEGAAEYIVYRASGAAGDYTSVGLTSSTSYTDTNVSGSLTYYYKIAAKNGGNTSEQSKAVFATVKSSATTLTISNNSGASKSITIRRGGPTENGSVYDTATIAYSSSKTWTIAPGKYTIVYKSSSGANYNTGITINAGDAYKFTLR
jgi:hypothetical protein